jgi:MoaA/NifB/PqqE/SkfB family radical SAM enzyme
LFRKNTESLLSLVHDVIVSLDGDQVAHDAIRDIPGAYAKLKDGVRYLKSIKPDYGITARTVIHRLNFKVWPKIVDAAKDIGLDQISFLPADVTSQAFNRDTPWDASRQESIMLSLQELPVLENVIEELIENHKDEFDNHFIAESPAKIRKIHEYYGALHSLNPFPFKKCNAPWVSTVIESDGTVRPCFFHNAMGNIRNNSLDEILNSAQSVSFRKGLDISTDPTCLKCVCYLNLKPSTRVT